MNMKNRYIYIMALFAVFACERVEELSQPGNNQEVVEKVAMTLSAVIDSDDTKTVLVDSDVENVKKVYWQPADVIGVSAVNTDGITVPVEMFTSTIETPDKRSDFKGNIQSASAYKAFYPYSETLKDSCGVFYFDMPSVQKHVSGSFDPDAALMVAQAEYGEVFNFQNLCSVLGFRLTGEETVKSISFSACDEFGQNAPLAGRFRVDPSSESLQMEAFGAQGYSITLNCEEPVQLDPTTPTVFYIMVPPGTYNSFSVGVSTVEDGFMIKETSNQLNLERSHIKHTSNLEFVACEFEDLSKFGTDNSYIVTEMGNYSINASTIGNGGYGLIEGLFHTETPFITPVSAELLWEDRPGVIKFAALSNGKVCFITSETEGNAVIAVKDDEGTILWSWHIWRTDEPQEHTYVNDQGNTYVMMDRALGSISAVEGDVGGALYYQWGRKDPFRLNDPHSLTDLTLHSGHPVVSMFSDLSRAVQRPTSFATGSDWVMDINASLWSNNMKTIYDPCPAGWRVPVREVWNGIRVKHDRDGGPYGVVLQFNEGDYFWYPDTPRIGSGSNTEHSYASDRTELWTSDFGTTRYITYNTNYENTRDRADGHPVRCMKDENYETSLLPMVRILDIRDINSEGATIDASVIAEGVTPVTERGIIWGTTADLTIDSPDKQIVEGGLGDFSYTITGLQNAAKYYVRSYAINDYGVNYSDVKSFITPYDGNIFNLSVEGTANCYIVPVAYVEYAFDATVKGNSNEPVGDIASVEVLWESDMSSQTVMDQKTFKEGDIISEVYLEDGRIHFLPAFNPIPGNALIAAKDADGNILWSWHIWVVDMDLDKTQAKLPSGAVVMDRNLGAISLEIGVETSFGLYYQWGRKDPFVAFNYMYTMPLGVITNEYYNAGVADGIANPTVVYNDAQWDYNEDLWAEEKTMYDPCPSGWKVPVPKAFGEYGHIEGASNHGAFYVTSGNTTIYFPYNGTSNGDTSHYNVGEYGYCWTTTYMFCQRFYRWGGASQELADVDFMMSVRCMKDEKKPVTGDGNDLVVDDKYEW